MDWIVSPEAWVALATLTFLEIVLGIDNIVFLTILVGRLPPEQRPKARVLGLAIAMGMRLALLFSIVWIARLTEPLVTLAGRAFSGRDLILIAGGLFLLAKATVEIHKRIEGEAEHGMPAAPATFGWVLVQIALLDAVFSLDSVITAVGMAEQIAVMVIAIVIAVGVMMVSAGAVGAFVDRHPTIKMLALSFLLLIGVVLVADGLSFHIPKGYIYFAMGFALGVEVLNQRAARRRRSRASAA